MSGNGGAVFIPGAFASRADFVLAAVQAEIERWRPFINADPGLQSITLTIHLASGGGHPRSVECGLKSESRVLVSQNSP